MIEDSEKSGLRNLVAPMLTIGTPASHAENTQEGRKREERATGMRTCKNKKKNSRLSVFC
jgi:hypothetical protein